MMASVKHLAVALALSCAVAGCQSHGAGQGAPGSAPAGTTRAAKPIDACSMVSPQDVAQILGVTVAGKSSGKNPQMGDCSWENPATYESISLQISNPGTAINNTLPPPPAGMPDASKPGPDGMRLMGGGAVEFVAGKRVNTIQVAVLKLSADQANSAAIDLARKIIPQVPE